MSQFLSKRSRRARAWLLLIAVLLLLIAGSNLPIAVRNYTLSFSSLPAAFSGFRIVHLSDTHGTGWLDFPDRICRRVQAAGPDIIVITGDLIESAGQLPYADRLARQLCAIAPVYYVTGNHEWAAGIAGTLTDLLEQAGVQVLHNRYEILHRPGGKMAVAGLDDPNGPADMASPAEVLTSLRQQEGDIFTVLLSHRNTNVEELAAPPCRLLLCGHSHGGVIRLPFLGGLLGTERDFFPQYDGGLFAVGDTFVVVSRGLGSIHHLPRLFNPPEISVITLECAPS